MLLGWGKKNEKKNYFFLPCFAFFWSYFLGFFARFCLRSSRLLKKHTSTLNCCHFLSFPSTFNSQNPRKLIGNTRNSRHRFPEQRGFSQPFLMAWHSTENIFLSFSDTFFRETSTWEWTRRPVERVGDLAHTLKSIKFWLLHYFFQNTFFAFYPNKIHILHK